MSFDFYKYEHDPVALKEFPKDVFEHFGVSDNPKAKRAFDLAWIYTHSHELSDVFYMFEDLVELIK